MYGNPKVLERKLSRLGKLVRRLILILLLVVLVGALFLIYIVRKSFPQTTGEIKIAGLKQPVRIYRDRYGIPQIYAASKHDLFVAQGFIHAQDRFWQMDVWRHIGAGSLSEMFGKSSLKTDQFLRTMGWRRIVQQELRRMDLDSLEILQDYSTGVNAYLSSHKGSELSFEYALLKLMSPSYAVAAWQPEDSLTWGKVMSFDLSSDMDFEIYRSKLRKTFSESELAELYPPYPSDNPLIVPHSKQFGGAGSDMSIGSNNWVISGKLTTTGKPFLCNDPHLGVQMPSIWYQVGLHCSPTTDACPFDVSGFSFAGVPGIIIGHNDRIAWGFTNVGPDVMDLYIEKLNPANPNQYEVNGRWVDMKIVNEQIKIAGASPLEFKVLLTRHGPIVSQTYRALENFDRETGGRDLPHPYAIALQWTALEPSHTFPAIWKMNLVRNWKDFRAAASEFDVPSQNCIYADIDGNIGYQMPGHVPIRKRGNGRYPVPGWTDEYEWKGYIPFEDLPSMYNPPQGYIASANNAVTDSSYPYFITEDWAYGFRARRIVDMIESAGGKIDAAYLRKMQYDNKNFNAQFLVPYLGKLKFEQNDLREALSVLTRWDFQQTIDSPAAALFETFWKNLLVETMRDDLPDWYHPGGGDRWIEIFRHLLQQPDHLFWDKKNTAAKEERDQILSESFQKAVAELQKLQGKDPQKWSWGKLHTVTFRNGTLGQSGIGLIERMFNRGPYPAAGGTAVVNATAWNASESFEVTDLPSMRIINDLSDWDRGLTVHTTGQSGHAFHSHYIDLADMWRNGEYYAMPFSRKSVEAASQEVLTLTP